MNISFVILHYRTDEDTISCVRSIEKLQGEKNIVIVDNGSKNGSFEKVRNYCKDNKSIYYIQNEKNLGFASGNNKGYTFAKQQLHSDIIVITNNDTIFSDTDFIKKLQLDMERYEFDIAGPDILSLANGEHQNPVAPKRYTRKEIDYQIMRYTALYIVSRIGIYDLLRKKANHKSNNFSLKTEYKEIQKNTMLHGATIIFNKRYIDSEEYAFRPGTFLYLEENLLYDYCCQKGYSTIYLPNLQVLHKEDSSTNSLFTDSREKRKFDKKKREFIFRNMINSLIVYRRQKV